MIFVGGNVNSQKRFDKILIYAKSKIRWFVTNLDASDCKIEIKVDNFSMIVGR